ncbi:orc1/cdc6 family replication initiation protein [Natrialba hulunbeirensis JCM 10989]|uniref:ORC1-type DNA replication protein n=1 Tax=Natrialba hulunbeirensis JCM 10989 TaxID=1227493 RepID=M0AEC5_9EURY|nr:orc1/cdc6 family replication initiation protein [Natrialba hulunbeirensis]ELY96227.1 orc1/cdc6 family replication initiation protein [Natrialba hulunbeirensis JCM 10989]
MALFERSEEIFDNENVLHDDYQPQSLEERDSEIEQFTGYLQPVINGAQPRNIFLYGKTGVGKTAATKYLLHHLEEDSEQYDDVTITTVYLNCEDLTSSYRVAVALVNKLRDPEEQISRTGYPLNAVYEMLWDKLDELGGTILIVLDEVDYIGDDDSILYQLPRARSNGKIENSRVGIIGISNDFKYREKLDPRVEDTLCERELHFPPYDATDLQNILSKRANHAFKGDVLDGDVVPLCAAFAAQDKGSARQALDLLLEAGDLARRESDPVVTENHVRDAKQLLEKQRIEESMKELTSHGHLTLLAVVASTVADPEAPLQKQTIYEQYQDLAKATDRDVLGGRAFHNHLAELSMLGILDRAKRNEGRAGGIYYEYEVDVPLEAALSTLENLHMSDELDLDSLRQNAQENGLL